MSGTSPHITDGNSPLEQLAQRALRRFGEMSASTSDGDVLLMFVDFANELIDDMNMHPYRDGLPPIRYWRSAQEVRQDIPDHVVVSGLLAKYAIQQESSKAKRYEGDYYFKMNQLLAFEKFGNARFEMEAFDVEGGGVISPEAE